MLMQMAAKKKGLTVVPDTDSDGEDEPDDIFEGLKVSQLKAHCRRRGLRRTGSKKILLNRLREHEKTIS